MIKPAFRIFFRHLKIYQFKKKEVVAMYCPCCSEPMLRHIRQNQLYWFCRHCWQTLPVCTLSEFSTVPSVNLPTELGLKKQHSSLKVS